jgi:hypothetical protein
MLADKNGLTVTVLASYSIALKEFRVELDLLNLLDVVMYWRARRWVTFSAVLYWTFCN